MAELLTANKRPAKHKNPRLTPWALNPKSESLKCGTYGKFLFS